MKKIFLRLKSQPLSSVIIALLSISLLFVTACGDTPDELVPDPDPELPSQQEPNPDLDPDLDPDPQKGTYRILAIGNSFSQDAVEQYLYQIAKSFDIELIIGNMYIPGCNLAKHADNLLTDAALYEYRKVVGGQKTNRTQTKLSQALADEEWDYISLQQSSGLSGKYESYSILPQIIAGVSGAAPTAKLMWHQTWAYAQTSTQADFANYGNDQMTMYNAITAAVQQAMNDYPEFKVLIPSGTAIQNARTTYVGDIFNRDGYHLEVTYGRYTAACTWFEAIFGIDVTTTNYAPDTVNEEMAAIARLAAHRAVGRPHEVTVLTEFATPAIKDGPLTEAVYVDFGPNNASMSPWNNITTWQASDDKNYLRDINGDFVHPAIKILGGFTGNYLGVSGEEAYSAITAAGIEFPVTAWKDGLIVSGPKGEGNVGPGRLQLVDLDPSAKYNLTILAARFNGSHDARISAYKVIGSTTSDEKQIKPGLKIASSGTGVYPSFDQIPMEEYAVTYKTVSPASDGTITIEVTGIDTGVAAEGHLNALIIAPN